MQRRLRWVVNLAGGGNEIYIHFLAPQLPHDDVAVSIMPIYFPFLMSNIFVIGYHPAFYSAARLICGSLRICLMWTK